MFKFGSPLDFYRHSDLVLTEENHSSAVEFSDHVITYINEELSHGAMLGPFNHKPIQLHISLFMTRERQDSEVRRTIVDFSWPKGQSAEAGISKDAYLGSMFMLNYPSVDNIVKTLI